MLITFTTDAHADISQFSDVALVLLKMMGHSGAVPGAILAADVPAALKRLTVAIDAGHELRPVDDKEAEETVVSLKNRALPVIDLLATAVKTKSNVMWK
jgi:hypothetical protein